jgi:hypothetical protein
VAGIWLSDGGSPPNNIWFGFESNTNSGLFGFLFSNFNTFSSNIVAGVANVMSVPLVWVRIQETASARIYSASSDGITFSQYFTEGNTAHFTTSRYGFAVTNISASTTQPDTMATMYSFKETNP